MTAAVAALAQSKALDIKEPKEHTHPADSNIQDVPAAPAENPLHSLPDSHPDWRVNSAALAPIAANSPLETRQQRRAAQKALARGLATAGKLKEREARVQQRRRDRADAAGRRFLRISAHVPSPAKD
jgi:L-aminopeptidase/D-esterase-like protein